jgi:hypothetical protein
MEIMDHLMARGQSKRADQNEALLLIEWSHALLRKV